MYFYCRSKDNDSISKIPEKIIGATNASGKMMLLMKFQGIDELELIVAKKAYSVCPKLVLKFYEERIIWQDIRHTLSNSTGSSDSRVSKKRRKKCTPKNDAFNVDGEQGGVSEDVTNYVDKNGAPREKVPEEIMDATNSNGQLMLLMKFRGIEKLELVVAKKAYSMCPLLVLKFYEERFTWHVRN